MFFEKDEKYLKNDLYLWNTSEIIFFSASLLLMFALYNTLTKTLS